MTPHPPTPRQAALAVPPAPDPPCILIPSSHVPTVTKLSLTGATFPTPEPETATVRRSRPGDLPDPQQQPAKKRPPQAAATPPPLLPSLPLSSLQRNPQGGEDPGGEAPLSNPLLSRGGHAPCRAG